MTQKHTATTLLFLLFFKLSLLAGLPLIPKPNTNQPKDGVFSYAKGFDIKVIRGDDATKRIQKQLTDFVKDRKIPVIQFAPAAVTLNLVQAGNSDLPTEGYTLSITPTSIAITSPGNAGLFYGVQSLMQLLYADTTKSIGCTEIKDVPAFSFRGMHLDVTHRFFSVVVIKRYLDAMAKLKLNQFHWQLTNAEKWSLEIKSNPSLTDKADFYSQEQVKEIVRYAQERFINVIPEINLPATADSYLTNKQLIDEVCALFPGMYIQIGNSFCDDSTLTYLQQKKKKLIGYDKLITPTETVLSYKSSKTGLSLAGKGTDVIMATRQYCSLDYYQDWDDEKKSFSMTYLPLDKAYTFNPSGKIKDTATLKHILGGQACVFSDFIKNEEMLDYQVFPRLLALAECYWTSSNNKNFNDFEKRAKSLKNYFFKEKEQPKIDLVRIKPKKEK